METQDTLYMLRGLLLCLLFSFNANAHPLIQAWQKRAPSHPGWALNPRITYFNTSKNFDSFSQSSSLSNSVTVRRFYLDLQAVYGFNENFSIFGRMSALSSEVSGTGLTHQSIFGFGDQILGSSYRLIHLPSGFNFFLQGEVTIPAYLNSNSVIQAKPFLGDGSMDFTVGGFTDIPLASRLNFDYLIEGGLGYTWRSKGYSVSLPWNIMIKRQPETEGLVLAIGMRGAFSLETDVTLPSNALLDQNRGAGGSFLINAINPSWTLAQSSIGYQTENQICYLAQTAIPVSGKNSPNGVQIGFEIQLPLRPFDSDKKKSRFVPRGAFKQYDLEAKVSSVNDQLYILKIDQGYESGVEKGQIFDIYHQSNLVAKAKVTHVKNNESALIVIEYFKEQSVDTDAIAKRVIQEP